MPLVTDTGFAPDDTPDLLAPDALDGAGEGVAVELAADGDPAALSPHFNRIDLIVVPFGSFADGRGFSLARRLRALGYRGRLRASGHLITDQYAFARACGFDEVAISDDLAARQPEELWLAAKDRAVPPFLARTGRAFVSA